VAHRLTAARPGTEMFLCDTFSGVVKAGHKDRDYAGGEHGDADVASVREVAAKLGVADAVHVLVGVFPEDTGAQVEGRRFKFAHIDVDVYAGARDAFEWLWSRLVVGAVVVFDDYGGSATEGIRLFVDELHGRPGLVIVRNVNGQAVAVRTGGDSEAG
jgi:O-methyltransferase